MARFRWGIFGTGAISYKFASGLAAAREAEVSFVASRALPKANALAAALSVPRAIEGYAKAAAEGGVDAIYVATPPSVHLRHALLSIDAGIPVLVEKPLASTAADARLVAEAARSNGVFAMEAMWTRFLPAATQLRDHVAARAVGDVRMVTGSFGASWTPETGNGMFSSTLGGGALAHLGPYPLSLGQWLFGTPDSVQAVGTIGPTGVDEDAAFQLRYPCGVIASFAVSLRAWAPDTFDVLGSNGLIGLRGSIVRPHGLSVAKEPPLRFVEPPLDWKNKLRQHPLVHQAAQRADRSSRGRGRRLAFRYGGNGYHYEADELRSCVERGASESATMPLNDSVAVAVTADAIREMITATAYRSQEGR
jgi:predicted dehydrogenase